MSNPFSINTEVSFIKSQDDFSYVKTTIKVVAVGTAAISSLERMVEHGLQGVDCIVMDTNPNRLESSCASIKLQLGKDLQASYNDIKTLLQGAQLVILISDYGLFTDEGTAPIIAEIARNIGALTITVASDVDKKYFFDLANNVDSLIINDNEMYHKEKNLLVSFYKRLNPRRTKYCSKNAVVTSIVDSIANSFIRLNLDDLRATLCCYGYTIAVRGYGRGVNFIKDSISKAFSSLSQNPKDAMGMLVIARVNSNFPVMQCALLNDESRLYVREDISYRSSLIFDDQLEKDQIILTIFLSGFSISSLLMRNSKFNCISCFSKNMEDSCINGHLLFGETDVASSNVGYKSHYRYVQTNIKIVAVGSGGGDGEMLRYMIKHGLIGADLIVIDTDTDIIDWSNAPNKLQIGYQVAYGRGVDDNPSIGFKSAGYSSETIEQLLQGAQLVIIVAAMGGKTGSRALDVAEVARDIKASTIAVVTKFSSTEDDKCTINLSHFVDTMLVTNMGKLISLSSQTDDLLLTSNEMSFVAVKCIVNACSKIHYKLLSSNILCDDVNVSLSTTYVKQGKYFVEDALSEAFHYSSLSHLCPSSVGLFVDVGVNPQFQHSKWVHFFNKKIQEYIKKHVAYKINYILDDQVVEDEIYIRLRLKNVPFYSQYIKPSKLYFDNKEGPTIDNPLAFDTVNANCNVFELLLWFEIMQGEIWQIKRRMNCSLIQGVKLGPLE